jgi:hypothetical protein
VQPAHTAKSSPAIDTIVLIYKDNFDQNNYYPPLKSYGLNRLSNGVVFGASTSICSSGSIAAPSVVQIEADGAFILLLKIKK